MLTAVLLLAACEDGGGGPTVNHRPLAPVLSGPDTVVVGEEAEFEAEVLDPDGDDVRVFVAWGDGDTTDYGEFIRSGQVVQFRHAFGSAGTFLARGRSQDVGTLFSDWSAGDTVVVRPRPFR